MATTLTLSCTDRGYGARVVDAGRPQQRAQGIPGGGAADPIATATANRLLNQASTHPCLETTLRGGNWLLSGTGQIVLTGAALPWRLNGSTVDRYSVLYLDGEYVLSGGIAHTGCRAYIGIRGTWRLPRILGSVESGLPGTIRVGPGFSVEVHAEHEALFCNELPPAIPPSPLLLRANRGPEWRWLSRTQRSWLLDNLFTVHPQSDRQGIRLHTSVGDPAGQLPGLLSSPVLPGTVQLTPSGPILLGPDAHTVGGYPRVLQVTDYAPAFQLRPGERLRFVGLQAS
ncbi:5-oxoprolinase subunit C [Neolewinella maritima]|uniref:5-oxoprolinase subunit C n=1 Tax=Neolewinella maritima TaxID=1383882 RepID=A0ABM9B418_9BACT|nr:biotin-dependent carboxyltransferase family protein [Neolewinella maritima]CAH1001922.1 5-oxoprolinase subunit C [Neolewinella maritima]